MNEADPGVELRIACQTFFDAGHSDQNQTDAAMVKDVSHLFKPRHLQPIRFVDDEQSSRIRQGDGHSHRAIPLFVKSILRFKSFVASITTWVRLRVAQLFSATEESLHLRVFVPARPFDCGIVQQAAGLRDVPLQMAW